MRKNAILVSVLLFFTSQGFCSTVDLMKASSTPQQTIFKFFKLLSEGNYYEAYKITDNQLWKPYDKFKTIVWGGYKDIEVVDIKRKNYISQYGASDIFEVRLIAFDVNINKKVDVSFDFHLSQLNDENYLINRMINPKPNEVASEELRLNTPLGRDIQEAIRNVELKMFSFTGFNEYKDDWSKYHSTSIDRVKVSYEYIQQDQDNQKELLVLCTIEPEQDALDGIFTYNRILILDFENGSWNLTGNYKFEPDHSLGSIIHNGHICITDLDVNGINEFHFYTSQLKSSPGNYMLHILEVTNNGVKTIWSKSSSAKRFHYDSETKTYYLFERIWNLKDGEGRYDQHRYNVFYYRFRSNKFELTNTFTTLNKYDYGRATNSEILNDALGRTNVYLNRSYPLYRTSNYQRQYKYTQRFGNSGNYTYYYNISGEDENGYYVEGEMVINGKYGTGTVINEDGEEVELDIEWYDWGRAIGTDEDGNEYELGTDW